MAFVCFRTVAVSTLQKSQKKKKENRNSSLVINANVLKSETII